MHVPSRFTSKKRVKICVFFISPRLITRKAAAETNSYEQQNASVVRENDSNRVAVNPTVSPDLQSRARSLEHITGGRSSSSNH